MTLADWIRTIRKIARQTIQHASIGRAGIRVYDGGWIVVENGGLEVEGLARVIGEPDGSGTLDWWKPWFLRGNGTISGDGGSSFAFTAGGNTVYFIDGTIRIAGMPTVMQPSYPGSFIGAVVADTSGRLYRVVSG